jgi:hypothetical protein
VDKIKKQSQSLELPQDGSIDENDSVLTQTPRELETPREGFAQKQGVTRKLSWVEEMESKRSRVAEEVKVR